MLSFTSSFSANLDSLLLFYSQKLSQHKYFTASFTQSRYLSMFDKPLVSTGAISFAHPDKIRFHYKTPFESVLLLSKNSMKRYRIENGKAIEQPSLEIVAKAITREVARYMSGGFAARNFPYEIRLDEKNDRHVTLIPAISAAKAVFDKIEIRFPPDATYIKSIKLVEPGGDYILIEHGTPSFEPLADSVFTVVP
jgi:outer membrane lipoprotein-sorting protein